MNDTNQDVYSQLDEEKIISKVSQEVEQKATAKATAQVEELKRSLAESLSGKKNGYSWEERGADKPSDFVELEQNFKKRIGEEVKREILGEFEAKEQAKLQQEELTRKQKEELLNTVRQRNTRDWVDLIEEGAIEAPPSEIQSKIDKGENLTLEERKHPSIKAFVDLVTMQRSDPNESIYKIFHKKYKNHAGSKAPVFGAAPGMSQDNADDYSYEDVQETKRMLGL